MVLHHGREIFYKQLCKQNIDMIMLINTTCSMSKTHGRAIGWDVRPSKYICCGNILSWGPKMPSSVMASHRLFLTQT